MFQHLLHLMTFANICRNPANNYLISSAKINVNLVNHLLNVTQLGQLALPTFVKVKKHIILNIMLLLLVLPLPLIYSPVNGVQRLRAARAQLVAAEDAFR